LQRLGRDEIDVRQAEGDPLKALNVVRMATAQVIGQRLPGILHHARDPPLRIRRPGALEVAVTASGDRSRAGCPTVPAAVRLAAPAVARGPGTVAGIA